MRTYLTPRSHDPAHLACYLLLVTDRGSPQLDALTPEERAWIVRDEQRWRQAHAIAASDPSIDVGGVYRVLRNLEKSPTERLRAALRHGRLFGIHRR